MKVNEQLTDFERVELTKKAYDQLQLGQSVDVSKHHIGTVCRSVHAVDGLRAYVISNPHEVTLLFKGSYGFKKGTPQTWRDEWLKTNLPILRAMLSHERRVPSQLKTASKLLDETIHQFYGTQIYIYGHSLGSINAQFALANCHHPEAIGAAYLYEGTNIWLLFTPKERRCVAKMREKIFNYVDIYDPVTLGITETHHMVGQLRYVDSEPMKPIKQHMWGGYSFNPDGSLKLRKVDQAFLAESRSEHKLLSRSGDVTEFIEKISSGDEIKKMAVQKAEKLVKKYPDHKSLARLAALFKEEMLRNED
ncbi:hypothetical protein [Lactobacillus kefiranofaciens]|uniref:DUF2974 domain-containing protein n=1 Tax=Lactobacillus kefiranofaciens TaxID=267818 RepID=A0AAX3UE67_9LACO|nr:hypothetical protein [Lactobacillus kefiranofaciens]AEG40749.1 Hypothetical protein WANG_1054 [Lactobacillus kefiranofaciens subsp. kefiranofaciens]KRL24852.1 hypothetical protein FC94_GL001417 [Lactobacillus kefiranofaciens subsp. kefirgranum DSM 10550 = JCM 8572]KRM22782.1 hypothetical protein FC93_GL001317 [Lactobacillus kefiranofaciens subsp. kefiranofaciens DSM 5016 = JCM 6985]MCJ2171822.1 hypothetical protein [Lactobacillus kefiranofaciens]MCP9330844.1 hypothetical protein [Lactobacil